MLHYNSQIKKRRRKTKMACRNVVKCCQCRTRWFLTTTFFLSGGYFTYILLHLTFWEETDLEQLQHFPHNILHHTRKKTTEQPHTLTEDIKYILYWTSAFKSKTWNFPSSGAELFKDCEFKNCYATYDRKWKPIESYAAILFFSPTAKRKTDLPERRSPHQRYVFGNSETPVRFRGKGVQYVLNNFYNWTMSYRTDSDIIRRNGYVVKTKTNYTLPSEEVIRNKTRSIAWFVSNCRTTNKREQLAKKLQQYIDVDVYGKCGNYTCKPSQKCYDTLERKYKYYLSFENSNCKDYTTEKLYNVLKLNVVPIVYGGSDYNVASPPHSVINVENFPSVARLADYLESLSNDIPRYLEYFEWKRDYVINTDNNRTVCQLCEMLNDPSEPNKVYGDIKNWWFGAKMARCKIGKQLPEIVFS